MEIDDTPILFYKTSPFLLEKMKHRICNLIRSFNIKNSELVNILRYSDQKVISKVSSFLI